MIVQFPSPLEAEDFVEAILLLLAQEDVVLSGKTVMIRDPVYGEHKDRLAKIVSRYKGVLGDARLEQVISIVQEIANGGSLHSSVEKLLRS